MSLFDKIVSVFKNKENITYTEQIANKAANLTGSGAEIIAELLKHGERDTVGFIHDKKTFDEVLSSGLKDFFFALMPQKTAEDFCSLVLRMPNYTYNQTSYRRSYRSDSPNDYSRKIVFLAKQVFYDWNNFDVITYLKLGEDVKNQNSYANRNNFVLSQLIALEIDKGNDELIDVIKEIILSDNNVYMLTYNLIRGVAMSSNQELHQLMKKLLLAAKLQEGLRQAILETADDGTVDYFKMIIECVLENDLLRFSSCLRAVNVWQGLGYDYSDKKVCEKLLKLSYECLKDEQVRKTSLESNDVIEMYAGMWAESVYSIDNLFVYVKQFMQGKKYQKLVALYFLNQADGGSTAVKISGKYLNETDLDVLTLVMCNYKLDLGSKKSETPMADNLAEFEGFEQKNLRDKHFESLKNIFEDIPKKGYILEGKPFEWCKFTLTKSDVFDKLMVVVGCDFDEDKISTLMELSMFIDSSTKNQFIDYFVAKNKTEKNKQYLLSCLKDKSMVVRTECFKKLKTFALNETDMLQVEQLLSLKTGEIRQCAIEILNTQEHDFLLQSIERLISDKLENKRLAALDMLATLKKKDKISLDALKNIISLMPVATQREEILVNNLTAKGQAEYFKENGFGLYDVDYEPALEPVTKDDNFGLKSFNNISLKNIKYAMQSLLDLIEKHKDYAFNGRYYSSNEDLILGNIKDLTVTSTYTGEYGKHKYEDYVLADVWLGWQNENNIDFQTLIKLHFFLDLRDYHGDYKLDYKNDATNLIKELFDTKDILDFAKWFAKKKFNDLAEDIVEILLRYKRCNDTFAVYYGVLADIFLTIPKDSWTIQIYEKSHYYYDDEDRIKILSDTDELSFFIYGMSRNGDKEAFSKRLALLYAIGKAANKRYKVIEFEDILKAHSENIIAESELYRAAIEINGDRNMSKFTGKMNKWDTELAAKYPALLECIQNIAKRVIEIELKRGDSITPVSHLAQSIKGHKGAETFAELLVALGNETLVRGYLYDNHYSKKEVLSSLLKESSPNENDTSQTLKACLRDRISDKRLLEATMYAPAWTSIVQDYLGWQGLKCAAWYFHAHTRNSFGADFETEVARFSPIDKEDFQKGAFDIAWFKEAYALLGEKRFMLLYDCAKYVSDGANHRRSQLFADAVLGKLTVEKLEKDVEDKRNKDLLLCYSLVPFNKDPMKEALRRFEFINVFIKKSKEFGAQRQASEKQAAQIALENLARNLGFADVLRFNWKMEMLKMDLIQDYFIPHAIQDVTIFLEMDEFGVANLVVEKNGKLLKSLPPAIKGTDYAKDILAVKTSLKQQYSRAKISLERAMENRDEFTFSEVCELLNHPVIAPIISKLVFKNADTLGFLKDFESAKANDILTIAHCYDLYSSKKWIDFQRYAFENKLIQPFKQIFRELYVLNDDEKAERTISRRYAGNQIQPKKTVALLKGRGWTVDYDEGLQKVYYKENIVATMYALADWYSPAEIEAPTLETVRFYERKTSKPIDLDKINPVLFSEIMRDVDLVVSVAHVGGVDPMASHSTIQMRCVIVMEAMRLLKISNVKIDGNHAIIEGTHGQYSVHLGSGIAHQMGRGALHIIPVHSQHRGRIFLPFMDEDPKTAEIVSKILLLTEDNKIKDPTVMMQINPSKE